MKRIVIDAGYRFPLKVMPLVDMTWDESLDGANYAAGIVSRRILRISDNIERDARNYNKYKLESKGEDTVDR